MTALIINIFFSIFTIWVASRTENKKVKYFNIWVSGFNAASALVFIIKLIQP